MLACVIKQLFIETFNVVKLALPVLFATSLPSFTAESRRGRGHLLAARLPAEGRPRAARRTGRQPQRRPLRPQEHPRHLGWVPKVQGQGQSKEGQSV